MMKLILLYLATVLVLLQRTGGYPARTVNISKGVSYLHFDNCAQHCGKEVVRTALKSGPDVETLYKQQSRAGRGRLGAPWRQGELDAPPTTARALRPTTRGWISAGPREGGPEELKNYISLHEKPYVIV